MTTTIATAQTTRVLNILKHTLLSLSLISSFNLLAQTQVIHAGTLLPIAGKSTLSKQTLIITDGKITEIKKGFVSPSDIDKDAKLIDLSLKWSSNIGHSFVA